MLYYLMKKQKNNMKIKKLIYNKKNNKQIIKKDSGLKMIKLNLKKLIGH